MKVQLNEETFKKLLDRVIEYRDRILIGTAVVVVALVALVYYNNTQKSKIADSEVQFVQGFYALQFGDTLNAPALLLRVHNGAKNSRIGSYAGLTVGIYYYQTGKSDMARQVVDASRKLDRLSKATRELLLSDIALDRGNVDAGVKKLDYRSGFKSIDEYLLYRKARVLMAIGRNKEAVRILEDLRENGEYFSRAAAMELGLIGSNVF